MQYKHIFGPVISRRLGISLGIDLIPFKTCSLDCLYCECGKTTSLVIERKEYIPLNEVIEELDDYLQNNPKLDFITFSGSGEPTLHSGIGKIITHLKDKYSNYSTALLTNGTLLFDEKLQKELEKIDLIIPSLDAVTNEVFKKINRPCSLLDNDKIINSIINFSKTFKGKIWIEIFIIPGINDSESELQLLKEKLQQIKPDKIQLNSLDRPGTEPWITKASEEHMQEIKDFFNPMNVEIIAKYINITGQLSSTANIENQIIELIKRRPCTKEDILKITGIHINELNKFLRLLYNENRIEINEQQRGTFYSFKKKI